MKKLIFLAAMLLASCGKSQGENAEAEYRLARSAGVNSDQACEFERRIEQAYLRDQNEQEYRRWRLTADITCNQAAIDQLM